MTTPIIKQVPPESVGGKILFAGTDGKFYNAKGRELKPHFSPSWQKSRPNMHSAYPRMTNFAARLCHHLMWETFVGQRTKGLEIDHINGNKMDWSLDNLEEVTPAENRKRAKLLRILRSLGRDPKQMIFAHTCANLPLSLASGSYPDRYSLFIINYSFFIMKTENLKELRELRAQEKAIKARIDEVSGEATKEALSLAPEGGEFEVEGVGTFQLQLTEVIDFSDYHRYKGEDAVRWREKKAAQDQAKKYSAALTKEMKGIVDAFVAQHPHWEPDEIKATVKCIERP